MLWESGIASGDGTSGIEDVCTGKPRRRISHEHGEEKALTPGFVEFRAAPGILNPSDPIDNLINAWGSILVTIFCPFDIDRLYFDELKYPKTTQKQSSETKVTYMLLDSHCFCNEFEHYLSFRWHIKDKKDKNCPSKFNLEHESNGKTSIYWSIKHSRGIFNIKHIC